MLKTVLFAGVLLLIAPSTRSRIGAAIHAGAQWMDEYAPFSLLIPPVLVTAGVSAVVMVKSAPTREVPESPMAKYRREAPIEE